VSGRGHETLDHTADMGIRGWGNSPAEAFEEIANAMFELMVSGEGMRASRSESLSCRGIDLTELLIEFLNGLIARADVTATVFLNVAVGVLERRGGAWIIEAAAKGIALEEARGKLLVEVKAATYYGASVTDQGSGGWVARCVVDL
jgi:SHS2 domain-containing protein